MDKSVKTYLSQIGRRGGKVSKRQLSTATARQMVVVREAGRAFRKFHAQCFWSFRRDRKITVSDVPWVVEQLLKNGNRETLEVASRLCL